MMPRIDKIRSAAKSFNDRTYPTEVYDHLIWQINEAKTPYELGAALSHALAWKDGKVRRDPEGMHCAGSDVWYQTGIPRPNTLGERHRKILYSQAFYDWAIAVRDADEFNEALLADQKGWLAKLWPTRIVLRVFVLHCLCPRNYPIVDQMVLHAYNLFHEGNQNLLLPEPRIKNPTDETYWRYRAWWFEVLREAKLDPLSAPLDTLKEMDAGLWVLGKKKAQAVEPSGQGRTRNEGATPRSSKQAPRGIHSKAFKQRAIEIYNQGQRTQGAAIIKAARELNIERELTDSHRKYPGSYFESWRRQGLG